MSLFMNFLEMLLGHGEEGDDEYEVKKYPINDEMFGLTESQKELRQQVISFAERELPFYKGESDGEAQNESYLIRLREIMRELGRLGLLGMAVPVEYGGKGGGCLDCVIIQEELSRVCAMTALRFNSNSNLCTTAINLFGTEEQKRKYLPELCSGKLMGTASILKPLAIRPPQEDYYILFGDRAQIDHDADIFIVNALILIDNVEQATTAFIIEKGLEGFIISQDSFPYKCKFRNCKVPVANRLGEEHQGRDILVKISHMERTVLAAGPVGIMQACCDVIFSYAHQMDLFEQYQDELANMYSKLCSSRSYLYMVARSYDSGHICRKEWAAVMLYSITNATKVFEDLKKILGFRGLMLGGQSLDQIVMNMKNYPNSSGKNEDRERIIREGIEQEYTEEILQPSE